MSQFTLVSKIRKEPRLPDFVKELLDSNPSANPVLRRAAYEGMEYLSNISELTVITVKIPKALVEALDNLAMHLGINRSILIRGALIYMLKEAHKKADKSTPRVVFL